MSHADLLTRVNVMRETLTRVNVMRFSDARHCDEKVSITNISMPCDAHQR
jgi:hypothetical protein